MRKLKAAAAICILPFLVFHSRTTEDLEKAVIKSSIAGTGIIESVSKNESRCSLTITADVKVLELFKGTLKGKPLKIHINEHFWRRASLPWQDDCPSVHYKAPPIEINFAEGEKIVFAADHFDGYAECYITAALPCDQLDKIKSMAEIR